MNGLTVDLTKGETYKTEIDSDLLSLFLGGKGLGLRLIAEYGTRGVNPFSPKNIIVLATSPLSGSGLPGTHKSILLTKSPLTNMIVDSIASSSLSKNLLSVGYSYLLIKGSSSNPVFLSISREMAEILDGSGLWGKSTSEVEKTLGSSSSEVATIGVAGEKLVRFSNVISGSRAFGRCGIGAVFGSKKLKAIVISEGDCITSSSKFTKYRKKIIEAVKESNYYAYLPEYGTSLSFEIVKKMGALPSRNFQRNLTENSGDISPFRLKELFTESYACKSCIIPCRKKVKIRYQNHILETEAPEFQALWAFGPQCGNSSLTNVILANHLCTEYGLDVISTGGVIGFIMECSQRELITERIRWGDQKKIINLIHKIANKKGIGSTLSEGVRKAALEITGGEKLSIHIKGLELPGYDPRVMKGYSVGIAVASRGGCHRKAPMSVEKYGIIPSEIIKGKGKLLVRTENFAAILDSLLICSFVSFGTENIRRVISEIMGKAITEEDVHLLGERIVVLNRLLNIREGLAKNDETPPTRFFNECVKDGPAKGQILAKHEFEEIMREYYEAREYSIEGVPTKRLVEKLDLVNLT